MHLYLTQFVQLNKLSNMRLLGLTATPNWCDLNNLQIFNLNLYLE